MRWNTPAEGAAISRRWLIHAPQQRYSSYYCNAMMEFSRCRMRRRSQQSSGGCTCYIHRIRRHTQTRAIQFNRQDQGNLLQAGTPLSETFGFAACSSVGVGPARAYRIQIRTACGAAQSSQINGPLGSGTKMSDSGTKQKNLEEETPPLPSPSGTVRNPSGTGPGRVVGGCTGVGLSWMIGRVLNA